MNLKCIVIDDEPLAVEKIKNYIYQVNYLNLEKTFYNGIDALNYLKNNNPDLIFLDIQMEDLTGIQLLESVKINSFVIITSAYDKYAIKGFELNVFDYILKPISFSKFLKSTEKAYNSHSKKNKNLKYYPSVENQKVQEYFFVKTEYRIEKINYNDILYIKGMRDYLQICTINNKIMTLQNFETILANLPSENFIRVHKSYVISINKIDTVERNIIQINNHKIPIGNTYKEFFFSFLKQKNLII